MAQHCGYAVSSAYSSKKQIVKVNHKVNNKPSNGEFDGADGET